MSLHPPRSTLFPYTTLFRSIQYPKPFDNPGQKIALSVSGSMQDESGEVKPTIGALYSNTFADDTLGILVDRSEEHTSELQSRPHLVCRLLLEKKKLDLAL